MLSCTITGSLEKPPLLFLHGFLGSKEDWREVAAHLQETHCCYAIDLPGHGESQQQSHILESLFTTYLSLKLPPCPLIGYSLGGRLALFLKEHFPKCFEELILIGAHPGLKNGPAKKERLQKDLNWIEMMETQPFETFLKAWYDQSLFHTLRARPDLFQQTLLRRSKQNPQWVADIFRNFSLGLQPQITEFFPKTLFLHGEKDEKFEEIYRSLPKEVRVQSIAASGHMVPLENPKGCAEAILAFIKEKRPLA